LVFVIERLPDGVRVSMSVCELLPPTVSVKPLGALIEAVFDSEPEAVGETVALNVNVAEPPGRSVTVVAIEPVPEGSAHEEPAVAEQSHVAPVSSAGSVSVIGALTTVDGPLLAATIVYVTPVPGVTLATESVFVIERSPSGLSVSTSVALLFSGSRSGNPEGGVTVAVLLSVPVAPGAIVPVTRNVAAPVTVSDTVVEIAPVPVAAAHELPAVAEQVHEAPRIVAGIVSLTWAFVTSDGPAFDTMIW
jgi:hypothetical protein